MSVAFKDIDTRIVSRTFSFVIVIRIFAGKHLIWDIQEQNHTTPIGPIYRGESREPHGPSMYTLSIV